MTQSTRVSPRIARGLRKLAAASALVLLTPSLQVHAAPSAAQATTGSVTGRVVDSATGKYLEGAEISVEGTTLHATSQRSGGFTLSNIPAGAQTLVINYPGLETKRQAVNIAAGAGTDIIARLEPSDVIQLNEFRVNGAKQGMAQAIAMQKASVQTKLVAAADQFGEVSEGNVGEYLKFLPGVSVDYNVNDARGISLRGLSTAYTIVAVDGTPMAGTSSMDDTRRFEFEQIAMNNVETTELYKTVTPDIPASSTAGFVNFVTKSAFDSEEVQRLTYNVSLSAPSTNVSLSKQGGVWGNEKEYLIRPSVEMNYARRITDKLGININYRLSEKYDDSPRTTANWNVASNPTGTNTIFTGTPRLLNYAVRSEEKLTHREALAGKLDYHLSDTTRISISGQWNWYDLNFTQRGPTFGFGTSATVTGDTYTSGAGTGAAAGSITNGVLYRNKYGTTWHFNGTIVHDFSPNSKASFTTYYSRANGQYRDTSKGFISSSSVMNPGASTYSNIKLSDLGAELPSIQLVQGTTPVPLDYIRDLGNYTFSNTTGTGFQSRPWSAIDTKKGVSGDYMYKFDEIKTPVTLKAGFALDNVVRFIERPDLRGTIPAITGSALEALADPKYTRDVAFGFGSYGVVDPFKVWDAYKNNLTFVALDDVREFHEKNNAGYLRGDIDVTSNLQFVGGLRWEQHKIDAEAQSKANARSKLAQVNLDYSELYPSLSFKYNPWGNRNLVVRGGVSRTVGHPDYVDVLPTITSESFTGAKDGTINVPDPKLKPYFSKNLDLSIDYYFKHSGVVSVYGYLKEVENYFISRGMTAAEITQVATDYGYNPAEFNAGSVTENGGKSRLMGVEVSFAQNLTYLPKPFDGLSIQANYTYVDVKAKDENPYRALDLEYSQLRAVSPQTANLILNYRWRGFTVTSTTNWVAPSLFGGFVATTFFTGTANTANPALDTRLAIYRDEKATTDLKVEYAVNQHVSVYFLVRNIFNSQRIDYYRGYLPQNRDIVLPFNRYEFGEPHLTLGVRGRF
ncbi:MAG TPA: TonB-dependent receptor [Opitutaceae bacterium]|nr:TonB-dependent receptor [Opitutaceae bacterium]